MTKFIKEDSPFCLTRAITRIMLGLCHTPLSLTLTRYKLFDCSQVDMMGVQYKSLTFGACMNLKWLKGVVYLQRSETELTLDANHPLAGKALNFEVLPPSKVNL